MFYVFQESAGEVTPLDLRVSSGQEVTTKQLRQGPAGQASILGHSHALEHFQTEDAVKTHPETEDSSKRANQYPIRECEQIDQGGGTEPWRPSENEQQRPRRSGTAIEMAGTTTDDAETGSEVTEKSSVISDSVTDSGFSGSSRSEERHEETPLLSITPVPRETEESSIAEGAEESKPHKDPDLAAPDLNLQNQNREGDLLYVLTDEAEEPFDRPDAVDPKPQTSSQRPNVETREDRHTHGVMENQRYDDVTLSSPDPSSDLTAGDSLFQSKSKSAQQTLVSASQPPEDTFTRKGLKLRPGVRGQRVRFFVKASKAGLITAYLLPYFQWYFTATA